MMKLSCPKSYIKKSCVEIVKSNDEVNFTDGDAKLDFLKD